MPLCIVFRNLVLQSSRGYNRNFLCGNCRLKHPNIVQLLDVYEDKAFKYLVMEL